ncbi:venom carboxylesterase-6-like [Schistocerca nitens]|uniref:venom carboxylesterase-6-like n=1 Tax=Schistocerca nitens TaxID=7011 RepID=UPI0021194B41|nr:venom carboxylesterase-6-like [Schistocerca nitens]
MAAPLHARCTPAQPSLLLLLLLLLLADSVTAEGDPRLVSTRQGAARGVHKESSSGRRFLAFYNLPYAKPPVGPLRFRNPQPPDSWISIRDATVPGPQCTQNALFDPSIPPAGSEDCLYLNVFTPEVNPSRRLPVMFWIHGGGWISGGANWVEPNFILDHDVVMVAINYRLGPLGLLSTEDEASAGNYALKDQVAALRWVKDNIAAFGGDPGNVTIFGQSAGGASVHYHMLSPLSRGLFQRAISQSGVAVAPWAVPTPGAAEKARKVAALLGCPTAPSQALVDCLRGVDAHKLIETEKHFLEWRFSPLMPFRPVVEGEGKDAFLVKHPVHLDLLTPVPWLIGFTKDEGCVLIAAFVSNETLFQELKNKSDRLFPITLLYHTSLNADLITKKIRDFYFPSKEFTLSTLSDLYSDGLVNWNTDEMVRKHKDTVPMYYYLLSYKGKYSMSKKLGGEDEDLGVCHTDDLFYLFSNNSYSPVSGERPDKDMQIARTMTKLWVNFATTRNPTPNNEPLPWPRVTSDSELEYLEIGSKLEVKKGLFHERVNFWKSLPLREEVLSRVTKEDL